MVLASLILQSVALALVYHKGDELTSKLLKYDELPKFEYQMSSSLREAIQKTQQKLACCGVDRYENHSIKHRSFKC